MQSSHQRKPRSRADSSFLLRNRDSRAAKLTAEDLQGSFFEGCKLTVVDDEAPIVAADLGRERLDRSGRLLAAVPDRVNLPRIADVGSRIALKYHQIGKLAGGQHAAIIEL